jgi:protein-disulfide isomerase
MIRQSATSKLTPPVGERDHAQGPSTAPVKLVEYGDYQCPYCGSTYFIVKELQTRLGERLLFVFRNFPLAMVHPYAEHAAEAAEAAGAQGKFWEMHDMLYENQNALADEYLVQYASLLDLDPSRFTSELARHRHAARVHEDFISGARSGVNGTPSFFINGLRYDGSYDLETMSAALENAML